MLKTMKKSQYRATLHIKNNRDKIQVSKYYLNQIVQQTTCKSIKIRPENN